MKGMTILCGSFPPLSELGSLKSGVDRAGKPKPSLSDYAQVNSLRLYLICVGFDRSGSRNAPYESEQLTGALLVVKCWLSSQIKQARSEGP
jgi:hypothetical protein